MRTDPRGTDGDLGATGPRHDGPMDTDLPEPVAPMGSPPDHPATRDDDEDAPVASPLDDLLPKLHGAEGEQ